jgi:hypothetical protein
MSDKQQTPSNVGRSLILIIAAIVVGTLWFVFQSKSDTDKTLDNTKKAQNSQTKDDQKTDEYKGWKTFNWESEKVSFKYPGDWNANEDANIYRVYVKNTDVDLMKEPTPENFQQIWLSNDVTEASKAREAAIKAGSSAFRVVNGDVKASTIKAGSLTINVYEYATVGGPTLEAYFENKAGHRIMATTSTEVGDKNQKDMVANLKKVLASIVLK